MHSNFEILPLFSSPVGITFLEYDDNINLILNTLKFNRMNNTGVLSDTYGYCSEDNYVLNKQELLPLREVILDQVNHYLHNQLALPEDYNFKIANSWCMKYDKGDGVRPHSHSNSLFSGILYTEVDELTGDLIFTMPNRNSGTFLNMMVRVFPKFNNNFLTADNWRIKPKNKMLVIFPSYLVHEVTSNESENLKTSIAFNIIPTNINRNRLSRLQLS